MATREWIIAAAVVALATGLGFIAALPRLIQPLLRLLLLPRYRLRIRGLEHLPRSGPVLLAANHVSWIDGFVLAASCPRRGRVVINADFIAPPILRRLAMRAGLIPIPATGVRGLRTAIASVREALDRGEAVGMFPEGQLSRNGLLGKFHRGIEVFLEGREHVPVLPVFLDNLWGSVFSFSGGRFFWKRPRGWRRTINIVYGPPVSPPITASSVRQDVLATGVRAFELRETPAPRLETIDPSLPSLVHPTLGPLAGSAPDVRDGETRQPGQKPGTCGLPLPGVALRVVDNDGRPLPAEAEGRLQALVAGRAGWAETDLRARIDRDGFVHLI